MLLIRVSSLDEVNAIRAWLEQNIGKGSEYKTWWSAINDQIVYRCNDGFSWIMSYGYYRDMVVEIKGLDESVEVLLKLRFDNG